MDENQLRARQLTPETLKVLAGIAVDPKASPKDRNQARRDLATGLRQVGHDISPDLRRELENASHDK
jgi:hypothetical protein